MSPLDVATELAAQRTGLAFHRTRLGADRTLLAITRTSLSLIGFGFTLFQFLQHVAPEVKGSKVIGFMLVVLGFLVQALGLWQHLGFVLELRREQAQMPVLAHPGRPVPQAPLVIAVLLLLLGLGAMLYLAPRIGA